MDTFAANLRKRIADLGLTQAEAARRCELENRRFHHYLVGDREPNLPTLLRIAEVLGTTPDVLLGAKPTIPVGNDEASRLKAKLSVTVANMDLRTLRLLHALVDGVVAFNRHGGETVVRLARGGRLGSRQRGR